MDGAAPGAKIVSVPRLHVGRRLHRRRAHRGHDRPRRQPRRRRRQHVDRRPAGPQRRQQRPRRALRPPHRRLRRPAGHLGRQQRPGHQHHRRPVGRHRRRQRRRLDHQGDLAGQLRLEVVVDADACFNFSSRGPREDGGFKPNVTAPGLGDLHDPDLAAGRPGRRGRLRAAAGLRDVQRHLDGLPAGRRRARRCCSRPPRPTARPSPRRQLRDALYTSADFIKGVAAIGQGDGQVDVPGAWKLLQDRGRRRRTTRSTAPVCTPISDFLATPDQGTGVYNRCDAGARRPGRRGRRRPTRSRSPAPAGRPAPSRTTCAWWATTAPSPRRPRWSLPRGKAGRRSRSRRDASRRRPLGDPRDRRPGHQRGRPPRADHRGRSRTDLAGAVVRARPRPARCERNLTKSSSSRSPRAPRRCRSTSAGIATGSQARFIAINPYGVPVESHRPRWSATRTSATRRCKPHLARLREPAARGLGDRGRGAAHVAVPGQPVHAHRVAAQGVTVDPETPDAAVGHGGHPGAGLVDRHQPLRSGHGDAAGRRRWAARSSEPQDDRGPRGRRSSRSSVPAGASRLDVDDRQPVRPRRRPRPVRLQRRGHQWGSRPTATRRSR